MLWHERWRIAAAALILEKIQDLVLRHKLQVWVPHAVAVLLLQKNTQHFSNTRYTECETALQQASNVEILRCNTLNPGYIVAWNRLRGAPWLWDNSARIAIAPLWSHWRTSSEPWLCVVCNIPLKFVIQLVPFELSVSSWRRLRSLLPTDLRSQRCCLPPKSRFFNVYDSV